MVYQKELCLPQFSRGFHLITRYILNELPKKSGVVHIFIKHTSASLTINENADSSVRKDFETHFNKLVSEDDQHYTHTHEGPDDMTNDKLFFINKIFFLYLNSIYILCNTDIR
jgi:secondary thiamine-phosphate synthase enzyme